MYVRGVRVGSISLFLKKCIYIFGRAGSLLLSTGFLRAGCSEQGLLSSCGAWASHCGGFSCDGAQALGCVGSAVEAPGLQGAGSVVHRGTWAELLHSMWNRPRLGIPVLAGIFLTTGPPWKSKKHLLHGGISRDLSEI